MKSTDKENEKVIVFFVGIISPAGYQTAPLHAIMIPVIKDFQETKIVPARKIQTMIP